MYGCASLACLKLLETQQKKAIRHLNNSNQNAHTEPIFSELNLLKLRDQIILDGVVFMHAFRFQRLPEAFNNFSYLIMIYLKTDSEVLRAILWSHLF